MLARKLTASLALFLLVLVSSATADPAALNNPPPAAQSPAPATPAATGPAAQAAALEQKATTEYGHGDFTAALVDWQSAMALRQQVKDRQGEEQDLGNIGMVYKNLGQYDKALEYDQQSLAAAQAIGDQRTTEHDLGNIGIVYEDLDQYDKALEYDRQSLAAAQAIGDQRTTEHDLGNIGIVYEDLDQYDKALEYDRQALAAAQAIGLKSGIEVNLGNIGLVYGDLGQYDKALDYDHQSLAAARAIGDQQGVEHLLGNIGNMYTELSQYDKALEYYQQALAAVQAIGDQADAEKFLGNIGAVYMDLGQYDKALDYDQQSLAAAQAIGDKPTAVHELGNIGVVYWDFGRYDRALEYDQQSLSAAQAIGDKRAAEMILGNIGAMYKGLGQYDKALEYEHSALTAAQAIGDKQTEQDLGNIGDVYALLGKYDKALKYDQQSLTAARAIGDRSSSAKDLTNIMWTTCLQNHGSLAVFWGKQAVDVLQSIRADVANLDPDSRKSYAQSVSGAYRGLADILVAQGRIPEAEQVLGLLKDEQDDQYLHRGATPTSPAMTPDESGWSAKYAALGESAQQIAQQLTAVAAQKKELAEETAPSPAEQAKLADLQARYAALDSQRQAADSAWQSFLTDLTAHFSQPAAAQQRVDDIQQDSTLREALAAYARSGTRVAALYTIVTDDRVTVVLMTPNARQPGYFPIKSADLFQEIAHFRDAVQDRNADPRPLGEKLYDALIGPVEKPLAAYNPQVLMWWLDGQLNYVPVAALWDGREYLVQRWQNVVFNQATLPHLALTADPATSGVAAGFGDSQGAPPAFPPLPNVRGEIYGIVADPRDPQSHGVLAGSVYLDSRFTKDALMTELQAHGDGVVHVATHFALDPADGSHSYLLAGSGPIAMTDLNADGLFQGVDILTLSACQTGIPPTGADTAGQEFDSLATLAQTEGALSVIATLWDVQDDSTAQVMQKFYALRKQGEPKSQALQQAQLALLGQPAVTGAPPEAASRGMAPVAGKASADAPPFTPDPSHPFAHPYYWAPFVLIGDWR